MQLTKSTPNQYSLFVHVPSFETVPEQDQLKFAVDVIKTVQRQLQHSNTNGNTNVL